ncbi:MAG: PEP-CTERM sorting domain-containing protein [Chthonomonadales bacterium]
MNSRNSRKWLKAAALGILITSLAPVAKSQLSATGPFVGNLSENFEGFNNYVTTLINNGFTTGYESSPASVFGGAATLTNNTLYVAQPGSVNFGLGTSGTLVQHDGVKAMGVDNFLSNSTFGFSSPIFRFGGYFGTNTNYGTTFMLSFFDASNVQIGSTQTLSYDHSNTGNGILDWYGFNSTIGVKRVVVKGTEYAYDGLQASTTPLISQEGVPEPGLVVSLIGAGTVGGLTFIRRRRSR